MLHELAFSSSLFRLGVGKATILQLVFLDFKRVDFRALGFTTCDFDNNLNISPSSYGQRGRLCT